MGSALLTSAEMSRADQLMASAGTPTLTLMRRAGQAVAEAAARIAPEGPVVVVAGRGNNGGDGFVAACLLAAQGRPVSVALLCGRDSLKGDAAIVAREWTGPLLPFVPSALDGAALIVDAIFGAGLDREVKGEPRAMIAAINAGGAKVLSVDLPSGINADTGAVMGEAVRAGATVTFFRRKPGHLLMPGRVHCGPVEVEDIGISSGVLDEIAPRTFANDMTLWGHCFPVPQVDGHKYSRGHAVVLSGGLSTTGAARLAARAALRAGAGLVTLASPPDALMVNASALTAIMVRKVDGADALHVMLEDKRLNAMVLGPGAGIGARTREMVRSAAAAGPALVLDADALTSFADDPDDLWSTLRGLEKPAVLTPHTGEFRRLFKTMDEKSKLECARGAAALSSAVVVLKGPDTVVASPDGRAAIADNAPPWLATAGSGDVLGGMIAGLLAQGMEPFKAACAGVWLHGEAGQTAGPGLIAEDLPDTLQQIYRRLFKMLAKTSHGSTM